MPRSLAPVLDADLVARLLATGDDAPSLDEKVVLAALLRAHTRDGTEQLDRVLLEQLTSLRQGLAIAEHAHRELRGLVDRLAAPPWHPALYLRPIETDLGPRAMVAFAGARRVVALGEDVAIDDLVPGEEVLLGADGSVVAARSPYGAPPYGETAAFARLLPDGRALVRWRDEDVVVDVGGGLAPSTLAAGDLVRWDRTAWMALERVGTGTLDGVGTTAESTLGRADVGGLDATLDLVLAALTATLVAPEQARAYGLRARQTILMFGPPGCGKTLMARVAAAEIGRLTGRPCHFTVVKPSEWDDPYYGVTGQRIRATFAALARAADADGHAVLFLDEIDAIARARGASGNLHGDKYLTSLLVELDGFATHRNVAVIAATNRRDLLDAALLSRFDVEVAVGRPTLAGARAIVALHLPPSVPLADGGDRDTLVDLVVSRLYAPNASAVARLVLRDGRTQTVTARELASGRLLAQICADACRRAYLREVRGGAAGLRAADLEHAIDEAMQRLATVLDTRNVRDHLVDVPAGADVVRVEPCLPITTRPYRYERAA